MYSVFGENCSKEERGLNLDLNNFLEIIQVQRHDFLNHLQVISGLLQLNKVDRAREYIKQVSLEIAHASKTSRIRIPEVTMALLYGLNKAAKCQVEIELTVNADFARCAMPGDVVGKVIEQLVDCALNALAAPEITGRRLEIIFSESEKKYNCRLLFPEPAQTDLRRFEQALASAGDILNRHGGRVNLAIANSGIEIFLIFPRTEPKS